MMTRDRARSLSDSEPSNFPSRGTFGVAIGVLRGSYEVCFILLQDMVILWFLQ